MTSKSKSAQERLASLEKASAPFDDQLAEAGKFIGVDLETVGREDVKPRSAEAYHGREEWLLRWVLKKLADKKDAIPRQTPVTWWLLGYLIQFVPRNTAARLLVEKKFTEILKTTFGGVRKAADEGEKVIEEKPEKVAKNSKKRKRTPIAENNDAGLGAVLLQMEAVHSVVSFITSAAQTVVSQEDGRDLAFTAEYMKTAIRTSAEESATILGLWLSLSSKVPHAKDGFDSWLSPFIELWQDRIAGENDLMFFSSHCTKWMLELLHTGRWESQLEMLVARNVLFPARSDWLVTPESPLLSTLTKLFVIQDPRNASAFYDISIRSIQTHGNGRRKEHDDSWLQHVFSTLQEGFVAKRHRQNCTALHAMLLSAVRFKVRLDLPSVRKVASQYAFAKEDPDWELVAALLKLDGNVFLIPDAGEDLLNTLLDKITKLPFKDEYEWSETISSDVLIPLMREFAKARDLTGFLRHWHAQLVSFEKIRNEFDLSSFSPWEGESLQKDLHKIFESSLTLQQITQILDWLEVDVKISPDAVSVILQAIAGAITHEDVADAVAMRLHRIMCESQLERRYKWRSSSIFSQTMNWVRTQTIESALSEEPTLFDYMRGSNGMDLDDESQNLEDLEIFRAICALWNASTTGSVPRILVEPFLLEHVLALSKTLSVNDQKLLNSTSDALLSFNTVQHSPYRGFTWSVWSCACVLFIEYPRALIFAWTQYEKSITAILSIIFEIACRCNLDACAYSEKNFASADTKTFPDLWISLLRNELALNCPLFIGTVIEVILHSVSQQNLSNGTLNAFAIRSLLEIPTELFSKSQREQIMTKWAFQPGMMPYMEDPLSNAAPLDPAVLSLQVKVMHKPTFYENMSFLSLASLAESFPVYCVASHKTTLSIFRELVRLTISQMTSNPDQARTKEYLSSTLDYIKKITKSVDPTKKSTGWNYATVALFDMSLRVLRDKLTQISDADVISASKFQKITVVFKESLLTQMGTTMKKLEKKISKEESQRNYSLTLLCIIEALPKLGVTASELASVNQAAESLVKASAFLTDNGLETGRRLETLFAEFGEHAAELDSGTIADVCTSFGRRSVLKRAQVAVAGKTQREKFVVLASLVKPDNAGLLELDKLLAIKEVIASCEDTHKRIADEDDDDTEDFDLSTMYTVLCGSLWKTTEIRRFRLMSEIMVLMLRTKGRCMSQWNIDSTLGSITIMCSRNAPSLRSNRASTIYLHLCQIMQAVLTSHRLKLQGHFHLVVQVMQTLLRCLFVPLPHSTSNITKFMAPPPWLSPPKHQLGAKHAEAYTRLLTLICDPSVSSVTRSQHNSLTSATQKAKGIASQHMQYVLTTYIRLQLEMRMLPEIREKMVPGIYAIFDTTTPEKRRMINDSLDSSGRSVFTTLFRDYQRFGKWKG